MFQDIAVRNRGYLPHWERNAGGYFVTFRLADSLPTAVLEHIRSEALGRVRAMESAGDPLVADKNTLLAQLTAQRIEHYLDLGTGACYLAKSGIAEVVVAALRHFHERRYRLQAWCVMPNHVHILFELSPGEKLSSVLHSWKSFTAKKCGRLLGTSGDFWQKEYYDHLVRNEGDLHRIAQYIVENPAKAGLHDWRWVWADAWLGGHR